MSWIDRNAASSSRILAAPSTSTATATDLTGGAAIVAGPTYTDLVATIGSTVFTGTADGGATTASTSVVPRHDAGHISCIVASLATRQIAIAEAGPSDASQASLGVRSITTVVRGTTHTPGLVGSPPCSTYSGANLALGTRCSITNTAPVGATLRLSCAWSSTNNTGSVPIAGALRVVHALEVRPTTEIRAVAGAPRPREGCTAGDDLGEVATVFASQAGFVARTALADSLCIAPGSRPRRDATRFIDRGTTVQNIGIRITPADPITAQERTAYLWHLG